MTVVSRTAIVALVLTASGAAATAQVAVAARANANGSIGVANAIPLGQWIPARGGQYSLHAGAYYGNVLSGFVPVLGVTNATHTPAQAAALSTRMPVTFVRSPFLVGGGVRVDRLSARANSLPPGQAYATAAKPFNAGPVSTAEALVATPPIPGGVGPIELASATTTARFETRPLANGVLHRVRTRESSARVFPSLLPVLASGVAGNLTRDPLEFENVPAGSVLASTFDMDYDDLAITLPHPGAQAAFTLEVGANVPGLSSSLGLTDNGLPTIFRLAMSFDGSGGYGVSFECNPSASFLDPTTGAVVSDPQSLFEPRFLSLINATPDGDGWSYSLNTLAPVDLFEYRVTVPSDMPLLTVDYTSATLVAVPTPGTAAIMLSGSLLILRRRRTVLASRSSRCDT